MIAIKRGQIPNLIDTSPFKLFLFWFNKTKTIILFFLLTHLMVYISPKNLFIKILFWFLI